MHHCLPISSLAALCSSCIFDMSSSSPLISATNVMSCCAIRVVVLCDAGGWPTGRMILTYWGLRAGERGVFKGSSSVSQITVVLIETSLELMQGPAISHCTQTSEAEGA